MKNRTDESTDSAMFQLDFNKNKEIDLQYPDFAADEYVHDILKKMQGVFAFLREILLLFYNGIQYLQHASFLMSLGFVSSSIVQISLLLTFVSLQWDLLHPYCLPQILEPFLFQR
ncbi:hypothetical protein AVEN_95117-1 [Araneus ventricosus]|uniref:Uncharacterized protein n=1 Tax=Araneus ventricosus TaxID=182803 RepID=A0A4Y2I906_ARAVE|nr:hypothetical protein AVEN_95117-1 [Araneus ventricosus]